MFFRKRKLISLEEVNGDQSSLRMQSLIKSSHNLITKLHKDCNAQFTVTNEDELVIDIDNFKLYVECEEDLFIVNEVFNEKIYGFNNDEKYVLIDIGANIGTSALFFSSSPQIKSIYAFEPVKETYEKLLRNIELNASANIKTINAGLGNANRLDEFIYSETYKGSVGVLELSDFKRNNSKSLKRVSVEIERATDAFNKIIAENHGEKIMVKIDCEGGEYEIIPDLKSSGLLENIDILMMEWHDNRIKQLLPFFKNFNSFYFKNSGVTGMLYATRKSDK